jgi:hypothetical protein
MSPKKSSLGQTSSLVVNVYDGTRRLMSEGAEILYRVIDGNQREILAPFKKEPSVRFPDLPFYDNFGDDYTVIASATGCDQAGFHPVRLSPEKEAQIGLMLLPREAKFDFSEARWDAISQRLPFLASGVTGSEARDRYNQLTEERPETLAALLNITTAMSQIFLSVGSPLDYMKQIVWEKVAQDRFFAYADKALVNQVKAAAEQGFFKPEIGSGFFHPGATLSFKQVQFGEANVQLTFHENDEKAIDGTDCVLVEPDMDYYKNLASHALLEVIPNSLTGGLTNPKTIYVLRWIAGRHAGVPEFNPPFMIV